MKISALDLGKYKNVFCEFNSQNGTQEYGKVATRPKAVHDLFVERQPDAVVVEIGSATGWVNDLAFGLGFPAEEALRHQEKEFFDRITGFRGLNGREKVQGTQKIRMSLFLRTAKNSRCYTSCYIFGRLRSLDASGSTLFWGKIKG